MCYINYFHSHCRLCGQLLCDDCSPHRLPLNPVQPTEELVRACTLCSLQREEPPPVCTEHSTSRRPESVSWTACRQPFVIGFQNLRFYIVGTLTRLVLVRCRQLKNWTLLKKWKLLKCTHCTLTSMPLSLDEICWVFSSSFFYADHTKV